MCVGIPMRVLEADGSASAWCDRAGERVKINMMLVGEQPTDTWVLTFQNSAIRTMTETEAKQTLDALTAVGLAAHGDVSQLDSLFADLIDREPLLQEHLRKG
jgi:hydrogenase assembly chaperone HypC/HupF